MSRYLIPAFGTLMILSVLTTLCADPGATPRKVSPLDGKAVIVEMDGIYFGVKKNVRFESIGNQDFIVIPMTSAAGGETFDNWWRLDRVTQLKVFDSMEAAVAHDKKTSPFRKIEAE